MLHSLVQLIGVANFVYAIYFNTFVVEMPYDSPRYQARENLYLQDHPSVAIYNEMFILLVRRTMEIFDPLELVGPTFVFCHQLYQLFCGKSGLL
jgi:hypothetical protein